MADIGYSDFRERSSSIFMRVFDFLAKASLVNSRVEEIDRLNALSDEALAKKGLRREDIVRHVMGDLLYL